MCAEHRNLLHFKKKVQNPKKSSYLKTRNKKDDNIPQKNPNSKF